MYWVNFRYVGISTYFNTACVAVHSTYNTHTSSSPNDNDHITHVRYSRLCHFFLSPSFLLHTKKNDVYLRWRRYCPFSSRLSSLCPDNQNPATSTSHNYLVGPYTFHLEKRFILSLRSTFPRSDCSSDLHTGHTRKLPTYPQHTQP